MLFTTLGATAEIAGCHPSFTLAFQYLEGLSALEPPEPGRVELGSGVYALVQRYRAHDPRTRRYESHLRYIDIQCPLAVGERMFVRLAGGADAPGVLRTPGPDAPYDGEKDVAMYTLPDEGATALDVLPGTVAVFFPSDLHKPCCVLDGEVDAEVLKVVVKVPV